MEAFKRIIDWPLATPYRAKDLGVPEHVFTTDDGLLAFAPDDIENPKNWSTPRRWYITVAAVLLVVNASFASSGPSGCIDSIATELHVSIEASGLVVTVFLLGYCAGPLFWAPLSEFYGRRWIFDLSFSGYLIFNFLCAFTPNFGGLLVGRFITGVFASSSLSNSPGVMADLWGPIERGNAMSLFAMMTVAGPALGPVIGGFLELTEDWRWSFYVLLWLAGITVVFMLTIPETYGPIVLRNKARRIRSLQIPGYEDVKAPLEMTDRSLKNMYVVALTRPWKILFDPISFACAVYLSVVYCLLYMLFTIYPIVFQQKRGWNAGVGELPLLGTIVGAAIGGFLMILFSAHDKKKMERGYKGKPEDRLVIAMIGGILFPITMFWFAWTAEYDSIPWIVPTLAGTFLTTSIILLFVAYLNYITDTYLLYAASALAANTVARSAAGAAAPLFTSYMFDTLGVGGGGSLIGGVACLLAPLPFIFYRYGGPIRERSKFAPTPSRTNDVEKNITSKEEDTIIPETSAVQREAYGSANDQQDPAVASCDGHKSDSGLSQEEAE